MEYLLALRWLALYALLALAALPAASLLFPRFPDRGASLALPVAMVAMALPAFWVGHRSFGPVALLAGGATVLALSALAVRRGAAVDLGRYAESMAVFAAAFALLVAVRAGSPGVVPAGGEKFLDFGLLQSVLRSARLPPEDVWFAGEPVRYYYGSPVLAALLARLAATPARFAYNLALAGFYATLVTAAYGLAGAIAARSGAPRRAAGLVGAFLVGLAGTLATPGRMLLGLLPESLAASYGHPLLDGIRMPYEEALDAATSPATYSYWQGRYVVPDAATLFPAWAFRNGDLNAYMVATPFLLLAAACGYAYYRTPEGALTRRRVLVFGVLPAVAGHLATVSTWSFPTAVGLSWLALVFADARPSTLLPGPVARRLAALGEDAGRLAREAGRTTTAAAVALLVGVAGAAWAAPYLLFHTPVNRGIGLLPPGSGLGGLLLVYGGPLGLLALYLAPRLWAAAPERPRWLLAAGGIVAVAALAALALVDLGAVALFGPFLVAGWLLLRSDRDVGYETVLLVAATGILLVVEFAYARVWPFDPNAPRWNTVYKVSMQAWVLLGTAAGAAVARLLAAVRDRASAAPRFHRAAVAVAVVVLAASATFPVLGFPGALAPVVDDSRPLTLDGTQYVERAHPAEAAAIDWLADRPGQPNVASAPGREMYTWVNGPATLAGVPTLAGWKHEEGYRGEDAYRNRVLDVRVVFTAPWPSARAVLVKHDVELIYLGPNERARYGARNFSQYPGVEAAFRRGSVTIYRVNRSVVDPAGRSTLR